MYSLIPFFKEFTFVEVLKKVKEIGFAGIQFMGGNFFGYEADELKALMEEIGLAPFSCHYSDEQITLDNIRFAQKLGLQAMSHADSLMFRTREEVITLAKRLNELGKQCYDHGMKFSFHNHSDELRMDNGEHLLCVLMDNTAPEYVHFELDIGWTTVGGADPVKIITQHPKRFHTIHFKEALYIPEEGFMDALLADAGEKAKAKGLNIFGSITDQAALDMKSMDMLNWNGKLGTGIIDWKSVTDAAEEQGCAGYISEREYDYLNGNIYQCLKDDFDYMSSL